MRANMIVVVAPPGQLAARMREAVERALVDGYRCHNFCGGQRAGM